MPSDLRKSRRAREYLRREAQLKLWLESVLGYKIGGDLACLQDGVSLCHLMLHLLPNSVDQIYHQCENNRELRLTNTESFLAAAECYGLPSAFCFQAPELVDGTNMPLVLNTLGMLSDLASTRGVPIPDMPDSPLQILTSSQSRVVRGLNRSRKDTSEWRKGLETWDPLQTLPEQGSAAEKGMIRFQALVRGFLCRKHNRNIKQQVRRYRVAKEILETEKSYVKSLAVCIDVFLDPLVGKSRITENGADLPVPKHSRQDVRIVFSDLRTLYKFHAESVLGVIEPRIADWNEKQCLGDVFLRLSAMMKLYTQYISNYSHSTDRLAELRKDPGWESWRKAQELQAGMGLSSFLIMPVQRVPRYILLLSELAKHTDASHPDASTLQAAAKEMEKTTHFLNTKKEEAEKREKLAQLSEEFAKSLGYNLAEAHRKLVREDTLSNGDRVVLCSDLLLIRSNDGVASRGPSITISSSAGSVRRNSLELRAIRTFPMDDLVVIDMPFSENAFQIRVKNTQEVVLTSDMLPSTKRISWKESFAATYCTLTECSSDDELDSPRSPSQLTPRGSAPRLRRQDSFAALKEQRKLRLSHLNALEIQWKQTKNKKDKEYLEGLRRSLNAETDDLDKALSCKLAKRKAARSRQTESCALDPSRARASGTGHMVRIRRTSQC